MKITIKNVRYNFKGKYHTDIFSLKKTIDEEKYKQLLSLLEVLQSKYDTYLPIRYKEFKGEHYISLTLRGCTHLMNLSNKDKGSIFDIDFDVREVTGNDDKQYINLWAERMKKVKGLELNKGTSLDLEF